MEKLWYKNYPAGVTHQIQEIKHSSLVELFHQTVKQYQDQVAYVNFETELTFVQLDKLSTDFASYLQHELQVNKGDRVALMCPNSLPFVVAMWGIVKAGAIQVNVNPQYTPRELEHQLNDAQADSIVVIANSTHILAEIVESTNIKKIVVCQLDNLVNKGIPHTDVDQRLTSTVQFLDALKQGKNTTFQAPSIQSDDLIFLQYTGGTTGLSKGAMLTHGNILANVEQFNLFCQDRLQYGKDVVVTAIPMYHIFALTVNTISFFAFGGKNVLITNPQDMPAFVSTWSKLNVTAFTGVNTLFNGLLHTEGFADIDFSSLTLAIGGGAPVQDAVANKWQEVTGKRLYEGYGLSETSPVLSLNMTEKENYVSGIGVPMPSTDISIRDDDGNTLATGEEGEVCAKGPQVMPGYWNNEAATADVMTKDGYFKTGDIGVLDEKGFFHIVDRKKDMILVSGFNVFPNEIEAVVAQLDGVLECACVGIPDEKSGEAAKLYAVKSDPNITAEQIKNHCKEQLSGYKVPKQIEFIDALPKSTVGKILRRELRG